MGRVSHLRANCSCCDIARRVLHMFISQKCCCELLLRLRNTRIWSTINTMNLENESFHFYYLEINWSIFIFFFFFTIRSIYCTLVSSKRSPPAARKKQIAMIRIRRPTKIPLAEESNCLIAIIIPLKTNNKIYILAYKYSRVNGLKLSKKKDTVPSSWARNTYCLNRGDNQLKEEDEEKDHEVKRAVIPEKRGNLFSCLA